MRLGVSDLKDETAGVRRKVVKSFTHPKYVSPPYFDVGVAEADEVIEFVNKVRPICLPMRPIDDYDAFVGKLILFHLFLPMNPVVNVKGKKQKSCKAKCAHINFEYQTIHVISIFILCY